MKTPAHNPTPELTLKYGLNVFFSAKEVPLPFGPAESQPASVRVPAGVTVTAMSGASTMPDSRHEVIRDWHGSQPLNGIVVDVPADFSSDEPIRIDLELAATQRVEDVLIRVGEGSRVTIVEHLRSAQGDAPTLRSARTHVDVGANAKVTHISLQDFGTNVTDFSLKRGTVRRDASLTWIECVFGGGFSQSLVETELAEEGAATDSKTMFFGNGRQRFDLAQKVRHLTSNTHSNLSTRGALADTAKTVYRGLVRIEKGTKGCTGYQKEDTLLLGERAEIDAVPNLEIESEDVRCGHGASVGRVDGEKLFYLMSRGLDATSAAAFLVNGFFAPIVEEMRAAGLEDRVQCIIDERVARLSK